MESRWKNPPVENWNLQLSASPSSQQLASLASSRLLVEVVERQERLSQEGLLWLWDLGLFLQL